MEMVNLPGVRYYKEISDIVPKCEGEGKTAIIISTSNQSKTIDEIAPMEIHFFEEFLNSYTETNGGALYTAVKQFFQEARACHDIERCPVQKVNIIDIGDVSALEKGEILLRILKATEVAEQIEGAQMQIYDYLGDLVGTDTITATIDGNQVQISNPFTYVLNRIDESLQKLAMGDPLTEYYKTGELRVAYAPAPSGMSATDMLNLTNPSQRTDNYIRSTRVALVDKPETLIAFAGVVAGSYWFENPGRHAYRTITPDMIGVRPRNELTDLLEAGINSSWVFAGRGPDLRLVWPVTTGYRKVDGRREYVSTIYERHAFDFIIKRVYNILEKQIYEMSTSEARTLAENAVRTFLQDEKAKGRIMEYGIECTLDPESPDTVLADLRVMLPDSIKQVLLSATLVAPGAYIE